MSVGFFPPIFMPPGLHTPDLKPSSRKKEIEPEQIMGHYWYLKVVFSNFLVAVTVSSNYYFTHNMRMM